MDFPESMKIQLLTMTHLAALNTVETQEEKVVIFEKLQRTLKDINFQDKFNLLDSIKLKHSIED